MKILLAVVSFQHLTGAEIYVYELGRELIRRGHAVTVATHVLGNPLEAHAREAGIEPYQLLQMPSGLRFNVVHTSEPWPTQWAIERYQGTPIMCSVHSQYPCEQPVLSAAIRHYVCIRPEVQHKIIAVDRIRPELTSVIYNPIDFERFHPYSMPTLPMKRILFCGTMDSLRKRTIQELMGRAEAGEFELWLLGLKACTYDNYLERLPRNVSWFDQTWHVENYIRQAHETAGILLGRTTIEGWACSRPGWIFDTDLVGGIKSRQLFQPPADMDRFDSRKVVDQLEALYVSIGA